MRKTKELGELARIPGFKRDGIAPGGPGWEANGSRRCCEAGYPHDVRAIVIHHEDFVFAIVVLNEGPLVLCGLEKKTFAIGRPRRRAVPLSIPPSQSGPLRSVCFDDINRTTVAVSCLERNAQSVW